jgi:hypothetical protein
MIEIMTQRSLESRGVGFPRCGALSPMFLRWVFVAVVACLSMRVIASESMVEAVRTYAVGVDLQDLQDPPKVFSVEVSDSRILDITEVRVGLNLVGIPSGSGFASEIFVSINKDFSATAVLLNKVGVTLSDGAGFGYDGWDVTFRDEASAGDVHSLAWPSGVMTGEVQPDGRVLPESTDRPARLSALHGQTGNGTWRLSVADLDLGGTMRLEGWSLTLVGKTNRAPTFVGLVDATAPESVEFRLPLVVRDADIPNQDLTIALVEGPAGAAISEGRFVWTPPETAGGTTNTVLLSVSDGVDSTTNRFRVVVTEANLPPVFTDPSEVILTNLSPYSLTLDATDADVPVQSLTFALVSGPEGAEVAGNTFAWTPFEEQRPSTNLVRIAVSDGTVTVTNQFVIRLAAINTPPQLSTVPDRTVREGVALGFNLEAVDADVPANALTYGLVSGPPGLSVSPAGRVSWVPSEVEGPGLYLVTVKVDDDGFPVLGDSKTFQLTVQEVNLPPEIEGLADRDHNEGEPLSILLNATDLDLPAQSVEFSLVSGPAGLTVSSAGLLEWTPTELQGPSRQVVRFRATDSLGASGDAEFTVNVLEVADPPVLPAGSFTINEMVAWSQALGGSDPDLPAQAISYALVSGPTGMAVTPDGRLTWTPTEAQGPASYTAVVRLSDETGLSTERGYPITVSEVNRVPLLATVSSQSVGEGSLLSVQLVGSDSDLPANNLTYALVQGPVGTRVDPTSGLFEWTPSEVQGPSTNTVVVSVSDDAGTPLSFQTSFRVTVSEVNQPPALASIDDQPVTEGQSLIVQLAGSDPDVPANALRYRLVSPPSGMQVDALTGRISWTPSTDQGPATYTVTAEVYDDADPSLSGRRSFQVIVMDSNRAPVAIAQAVSGTEEVSLSIRLAATDADGDPLTYSIVTHPTKGTLAGFPPNLTYVPAVNAFGADSFTFRANDGTMDSLPATVAITLAGVDDSPVVQGAQVTLSEDTPVSLTLNASDPDGDPLSYTILNTPQRGTLSGIPPNLTYTPNADVSGADQVTFKVTDGRSESGVATIYLSITAVNDVPTLSAISDQTTLEDTATGAIAFTVGDVETAAGSLTVTAASSNLGVVAADGIALGGSGAERTITLSPVANASGTSTITVTVTDGGSLTATRSFVLTVTAVNDPPIPEPSELAGGEDRWLPFQLRARDVEGDRLRFRVVQVPAHGRVELNSLGGGTYWPEPDFHGEDSFGWVVSDSQDDSAPVLQRVFVAPDYDAPRPRPDTLVGKVGGPVSLSTAALVANDLSPDGTPLRVARWDSPTRGDIMVEPVGPDRWNLVPPPGFTGTVILQGWVTDGRTEVPSTVRVIVAAGPGAPVAVADFLEREFALALDFPAAELLDNDAPSLGAGRLVAVEEFSRNGARVTRRADSTVRLESETLFTEDAFRYQLEDESGARAWGEVVVRMNASPARLALGGLLRGTEAQATLSGTPRAPYRLQSAPTPAGPFLPLMGVEADRFGAWTGSIRLQDSGQFFRAAPDFLPGERPVLRLAGAKGEGVWGLELRGLPGVRYRIYCCRDDRRTKAELANLLVPHAGVMTMDLHWNEDGLIIWAEADP